MEKEKSKQPFDSKEMEQWLDSFFLDPYTAYLDETVFRIDLYDSETSFIIEALLPAVKKENIDITITSNELQIKVKNFDSSQNSTHIKSRTVRFPVDISNMEIEANYQHDILEIKILKDKKK